MDPLVQKGIDCKWVFDTQEEAQKAIEVAYYLPGAGKVTCNGETAHALNFPWCSAVSGSVHLSQGCKYQACILISLSKVPAHPVEPANPYGLQLQFDQKTFRCG